MKDTSLEKLIHRMLSRQSAMMVDRILPWLERLEANNKALRERQEACEAAMADMMQDAGSLNAMNARIGRIELLLGKDIRPTKR